jgi:hypothetical protein
MYDASPENELELDYEKTKSFLSKFDWSMINICGFYGGEPSVSRELYDKFIDLIPNNIPRFVITNGSWSTSRIETHNFLMWCCRNRLYPIVSSTSEHIKYQDRLFLENLAINLKGALELKLPDEIHAQGRAKNFQNIINDCKKSCLRTDRNIRLGLKPDGNIVFQNCHGEYHIVQNYEDEFDGILERTNKIKEDCLKNKGE